jgi:hypothetical protein
MNKLRLELDIISGKDTFEYENITFTNCVFLKLKVDGINLITRNKDRKGIIVWDELKKTLTKSGQFLILTCICGVADDAGFDFVDIKRNEHSVSWRFNDESKLNLEFRKKEYDQELLRLKKEINKLDTKIKLEPINLIYPE